MSINTRSPYYITSGVPNTHYGELAIQIWTGDGTATATPVIYTIKKFAASGSIQLNFEISELIRDYLDVTFDGDYDTPLVWVRSVLKIYNTADATPISTIPYGTQSAFESYDYFVEGGLFNIEYKSLLMSNREIFVLSDNSFRIPVHTRTNPTVSFIKNGVLLSSQTFSGQTASSNQIEYVSVNGLNTNYDSFKSRVLLDGTNIAPSAFENSKCLRDFFEEFEIGEVDTVRVKGTDGLQEIKITTVDECKYEPKKVTFVNRFGVLQDMFFFKKSVEKMNVKKESFKANTRDAQSQFSTSNHVNRDFNLVAKESVTLSSGYLSEEYNEVFRQLMLSEKVWVTNVNDTAVQVLPINVKTSDITYKTSLNDKLVEYTIEFDNSFDTINNIR